MPFAATRLVCPMITTGTLVFIALVILCTFAILLLGAFVWGIAYAISIAMKLLHETDQDQLDPFRRKHA